MAWVDDDNASLLTDLYELTMAASYFGHRMNYEATFDVLAETDCHRMMIIPGSRRPEHIA